MSDKPLFSTRAFLAVLILLAALMYTVFFSVHSEAPDAAVNLLLGKEAIDGDYSETFFHRMPLVPFAYSAAYLKGLGVEAARFLMPLLFIIIAIVGGYYFLKEVAGEKKAMYASLLLLAFPMFWRWGAKPLSDTALMAFSMLLLYFFYRALKDKKYFYWCGIILGLGMATRLSFIILPGVLFIYLLFRRRDVFRKKELWVCVIAAVIIFSVFFGAVFMLRGEADIVQFGYITSRATGQGYQSALMEVLMGGESVSLLYFLKLSLFPLIIFFPFGVWALWKRGKRLPIAYFFVFLALFIGIWTIRLRYFSPLYPILMLFVVEGFMYLRGRFNPRRMLDIAFAALVVVSFANAAFLVSLDSNTYWGVDVLAGYTETLDGRIASYYMLEYLDITNSVIRNQTVIDDIFFKEFSYQLLKDNGVDYLVVSVYDEFRRSPTEGQCMVDFGPFQIERPCTSERPPTDYTFRSEWHGRIQLDSRMQLVKEIKREGQDLFQVYKVL